MAKKTTVESSTEQMAIDPEFEKRQVAVAPIRSTSLATLTPSFLHEDIPLDKVKIPRLTLLQAMSETVQLQGKPVGTFQNSITGENYGATLRRLLPIRVGYGAVYLVKGEGMKCRSNDGVINMYGDKCEQCPFGVYHAKWNGKEPPKCTRTINILCLIDADPSQPVVLSFRSMATKEGDRLASALRCSKSLKAFSLSCRQDKNDKGIFFVPVVMSLDDISEEEFAVATAARETFTPKSYEVHEEDDKDA